MFTGTLSGNAQNTLALLGKSKTLPPDTYMAGGSALALQYGHRVSIDFDFFTPSSFVGKEIIKQLEKVGNFILQETAEKNTLLGLFNSVKFSLFLYEYPLISAPIIFNKVRLASPQDIAAMKIAAVMDRGTKKDFIDLFFLSKNGIDLNLALNLYDNKYGKLANNMYSIIKSLSYFDDAESLELPQMIKKINWEEVKAFFQQETIRLAKKYIG